MKKRADVSIMKKQFFVIENIVLNKLSYICTYIELLQKKIPIRLR